MEGKIDKQIRQAEVIHLRQQNQTLNKQNQLLKQELDQLKTIQTNTKKELTVYRKAVLSQSEGDEARGQVLEMQHERIVELETQLELLQGKYGKLLKSAGSTQQTDLTLKCREYQRRMKEREVEHQREVGQLKQRLVRRSAAEINEGKVGEGKRFLTSPTGGIKKSGLGVGKFV